MCLNGRGTFLYQKRYHARINRAIYETLDKRQPCKTQKLKEFVVVIVVVVVVVIVVFGEYFLGEHFLSEKFFG